MAPARASTTPRGEQRARFGDDVRLALVEDDLDDVDQTVAAMRQEFHEDVVSLRGEIAATRQVLTGILVALVVASIMLAINLAVTKVGG